MIGSGGSFRRVGRGRLLLLTVTTLPLAVVAAVVLALGTVTAAPLLPTVDFAFDEGAGATVHDSAHGLTGSAIGTSWISDGATGSALRFDGAASRVVIPDAAALHPPNRFTISLWVRADPLMPPTDGAVILERGDASCAGGSYAIVVDGDTLGARVRDSSGTRTTGPVDPRWPKIWDGGWHHIAIRGEGGPYGGIALYIDGWIESSVGAFLGFDTSGMTATDLVVGGPADPACGGGSFHGDVDDLTIWPDLIFDELTAMDRPVATTTSFLAVPDSMRVGERGATATVRIGPVPPTVGLLRVFFVDETGTERQVGGTSFYGFDPTAPQDVTVQLYTEYGGAGHLVARFEPTLPELSSTASVPLTVDKEASSATIRFRPTAMEASDPIDVTVYIGSAVSSPATGFVTLFERTASGVVALGTAPARPIMGTAGGSATFVLPPRPAGTYTLAASYSGDPARLEAEAEDESFVVYPVLAPGTVTINGGATVTDNPIVTVSTPAVGAIAMAVGITTDGNDRRFPVGEDYAPEKVTWLTAPWYGDDADGPRTVYVRWADHHNEWGPWSSATILLDRGRPTGTVVIDGGVTSTISRTVTVSVPISDPATTTVHLSNDGVTWSQFAYAPTIPWTIPAKAGMNTVHVRWAAAPGSWSMERTATIYLYAPTAPRVVSLTDRVAGTSSIPGRITWSGSTAGSNVIGYDVQSRRDAGSWTTVARHLLSTSMTMSMPLGHVVDIRVRAAYASGASGTWIEGTPVHVGAYSEHSSRLTYVGTWGTRKSTVYQGGGDRFATSSSARASFTFTGRSVSWVSALGPTRGKARVYVDGVQVATVNLHASTSQTRRVVWARSWSSGGAHTIVIRVSGTPGHARVDIDTFVVLS